MVNKFKNINIINYIIMRVITYSLWCQEKPMDDKDYQTGDMYCNGAIRNLEIQRDEGIYEDWRMRFYINESVPERVKSKIVELGGELVDMTGSKIPGMFWRFLAFDDPKVGYFIARDVDSRINRREESAVLDWIRSNKYLHVMRDHPHHHYKILGGMWGYRNDLQRYSVTNKIHRFLGQYDYKFKRMDDMRFLDSVYDYFFHQKQVKEHDGFFKMPGDSVPFPDIGEDTSGYYPFVGEIYDAFDNRPNYERNSRLLVDYKTSMSRHWCSRYFI
tara:strand:- start:287 stop:1105 length:819 start_codon:yes stop_codon:yes gene_type:complete